MPKDRSGSSAKALRVAEQLLLAHTEPKAWIEYILKSGRGRWPEAEKKLLRHDDTDALLLYARDVMKSRWPEAETRLLGIVKKGWFPGSALRYTEKVIRGSWPELRACLSKDYFKAEYAKVVLNGKELETELLKYASVDSLIDYAMEVRKERWPEIEPMVLKKADWEDQVRYAKALVMPEVWQEWEAKVLGSGGGSEYYDRAIEYIKEVKQARDQPFEKRLLAKIADKDWDLIDGYRETVLPASVRYAGEVVRGRWLELEKVFLEIVGGRNLYGRRFFYTTCNEYVRALGLGGWPEYESVLLDLPTGRDWLVVLLAYARSGIGGKLPAELHNRMLATAIRNPDDEHAKSYCEFLESLSPPRSPR
jgi:hypothetical protein